MRIRRTAVLRSKKLTEDFLHYLYGPVRCAQQAAEDDTVSAVLEALVIAEDNPQVETGSAPELTVQTSADQIYQAVLKALDTELVVEGLHRHFSEAYRDAPVSTPKIVEGIQSEEPDYCEIGIEEGHCSDARAQRPLPQLEMTNT